MTLNQKVGKAIVKIRKERGISQEQFVYSIIGRDNISIRYLSDVENGIRNISLNVLQTIADGFGMKLSELAKIAEEIEDEG